MHEAWCSRGRNQRFHNLFRKEKSMEWVVFTAGILCGWGIVLLIAVTKEDQR